MLDGTPAPLTARELMELVQIGAWGLGAGVIGAMAKSRTWRLPKLIVIREKDGSRSFEVDWGTVLVAPLCGMVLAMIFDGRPQTAIAYGLAGGFVGPALINAVVDGVLKKLGIVVAEAPTVKERGELEEWAVRDVIARMEREAKNGWDSRRDGGKGPADSGPEDADPGPA